MAQQKEQKRKKENEIKKRSYNQNVFMHSWNVQQNMHARQFQLHFVLIDRAVNWLIWTPFNWDWIIYENYYTTDMCVYCCTLCVESIYIHIRTPTTEYGTHIPSIQYDSFFSLPLWLSILSSRPFRNRLSHTHTHAQHSLTLTKLYYEKYCFVGSFFVFIFLLLMLLLFFLLFSSFFIWIDVAIVVVIDSLGFSIVSTVSKTPRKNKDKWTTIECICMCVCVNGSACNSWKNLRGIRYMWPNKEKKFTNKKKGGTSSKHKAQKETNRMLIDSCDFSRSSAREIN